MSKLTELIEELCPEGVEYRTIEELFDTRNGYTPSRSNPDFWVEEGIPWFRMDDIRTNGNILNDSLQHISPKAVKGGKLFPAGTVIVATSATIGEHALLKVPALSNQRFTALITKPEFSELLLPEFVHYYCFILDDWCVRNTTQSSFASVDMPKFRKFRFPVPPLEVQQEIVRVLDAFTDLEQNLVAELELRQKQLAHIRRETVATSQLTFGEKLLLGEAESQGLVEIGRGKVISKKDIAKIPGDYPVYSSSGAGTGEFGRYGQYMFDDERITWSVDGGGRLFYRPKHRYSVTNVSGWMTVDTSVLRAKYLYYVLLSQWEEEHFDYTRKAHPSVIRNIYEFSIPPLDAQDKVISTLHAFELLIQSLEEEIALRRKQYEFYRDELLTFTPKEV